MATIKFPTGSLETLYRRIPYFNRDRLAATSFTNTEYLSMLGIVYIAEIDVTIASLQAQWIRFVAPVDRDVQILDRNLFTTISGGEYNIYFSASAFTDDTTNKVKIETVNPLPGVSPTSICVSQSVAPTVTGPYFTPIMAGYTASNNPNQQPVGTPSGKSGLRTYGRGTGFYGRIYNPTSVSQRMILQITYAELDNSIIP